MSLLLLAALVAAPEAQAGGYWQGAYAGLNLGYGWGTSDIRATTGDGPWQTGAANQAGAALIAADGPDKLDFGSAVGGGQVGYNYQSGRYVLGLETSFDRLGATKQSSRGGFVNAVNGASFTFRESIEPDWLVTLQPRVGYAIDRFLPYVTGGLAVGHQHFTDRRDTVLANGLLSNTPYPVEIGKIQIGWTAGSGIEWAIAKSLSLRADYLHSEFGRAKGTAFGGGNYTFGIDYSSAVTSNMVRVGLDYRFGKGTGHKQAADPDVDAADVDWSGLYAGVNTGFHRTTDKFNAQTAAGPWQNFPIDAANINATGTNALSSDNGSGGVQIGFTKQIGPVPIGFESDLDYIGNKFSDASHSFVTTGGVNTSFYEEARTNWLATARPRFGVSVGSLFPYLTGGLALTNLQWSDKIHFASNNSFGYRVAKTETLVGWAAGAGLECLMTDHWSVKGEYLRAEFDSSHAFGIGGAGNAYSVNYASNLTMNIARVGLNYHF